MPQAHDMADRKTTEKAFLLDAVVREMRTGIVVINAAGVVEFANPFFLKSFPSAGDAAGRPFSSITGSGELASAIGSFLDSGHLGQELEIKEGERFFSVRMVPLEKERGLILFLRDVTEEKRVEAIKKDFVANVSHELRTPLASIKGYAETLLDADLPGEKRKEFLRVIDRHASRMSRIIDDLLVLSRLESQEFSMALTEVDTADLLLSTMKGFEKQAADRAISLSADLEPGLPPVRADRDRIEQVVTNLLDNAIKYTQPGGRVTLRALAVEEGVRVDVIDTGIGIPAEDIPRIFERFYRVDKARSRALGGTGLGLAIVKHIIQAHGGSLHVQSRRAAGSTFSFTVPAAR